MTLTAVLDALAVHALASATAANATFTDVAVGFPMARGKNARVYYAGQRESVYFGESVLNAQEIADVVMVDFFWPVPSTAAGDHRATEIEIGTVASQFRTRINGDFTLGGACIALKVMPDARAEGVEISNTRYHRLSFEIGLDTGEFTYAP